MASDNASTTPLAAQGQSLDPTHMDQAPMDQDHTVDQVAGLVDALVGPQATSGATAPNSFGASAEIPGTGSPSAHRDMTMMDPQSIPPDGSMLSQVDDEAEPLKTMSDDDLVTLINMKIQSSHQWYGSGKLSSQRIDADKYYRGEPLGNEIEGRSQVVSRDVAEAVDSLMPSFMRIFASGDRVVVFEPNTQNDIDAADQATDYINHIVLQDNDGFEIFHTWIKDALLKKNGIIKVVHDVRLKRTKDTYQGLTQQQWMALKSDPTLQLTNVKSYIDQQNPTLPGPIDPHTGQPSQTQNVLYDCVAVTTKPQKRVLIQNVAPDEFIIERRATGIDDAGFMAHRGKRTLSDLLECGYDYDLVMSIPTGDDQDFTTERIERFADEDQLPYGTEGESLDPTMRKVWVTEAYIKVDQDGDGIAEWHVVTLAGNMGTGGIILDNVETDDHAFCDLTPNPEPHKFYGQSIFDQTKDIQDIKTALVRGVQDSIYFALAPRWGAVEGQVNLDDLLDVRPGGVVRLKNAMGVVPMPQLNVAPEAQAVVEYWDNVKERRTGISAQNQGLSPDMLSQTATGISLLQNAGQQRIELMARVFAERGFKRLYRRVFQLTCQYQDEPRTIRLRNKWVNIDPRDWKDRMDVTVGIGAGAFNKDQQLQTANGVLQVQEAIVKNGGAGTLVTPKNIYNTLVKFVEAAGWKTPDPYFTDPDTAPPKQPPPPDPDVVAAQISAQAEIATANINLEIKKVDLLMKQIDLQIKGLEHKTTVVDGALTIAKHNQPLGAPPIG